MLSLHHLRTFEAVVAAGGVRSSSDVLLRAASAVSRSVQLLEGELDTPLFERKGRGMLLTAEGEMVHARFVRIEHELNAVLDEAGITTTTSAAVDTLFDEKRLLATTLLAEVHHMPTVGRLMGVTQPAVSAAVSRLEDALGRPLFLRTARGMIATDIGARWVMAFDRALVELRHLEDDVRAARGRMDGVVMVGSLPLARSHMLPQAIGALQAEHPAVRVHSVESPYEQLCAGVLSGKVDFIVGALRPNADRSLTSEVLLDDKLGLIASAHHPLASRRQLGFDDLRAYPWVLSRPGTPLRDLLADFFESHDEPAPTPSVETGDQTLVRSLLLQGRMLTVLSTRQLHYEIAARQLAVLPLPMDGLQRRIGLTTRTGAHLSTATRALIAQIRRFSEA
jgi:LysR family transcriptional regulator of gallate degradation